MKEEPEILCKQKPRGLATERREAEVPDLPLPSFR